MKREVIGCLMRKAFIVMTGNCHERWQKRFGTEVVPVAHVDKNDKTQKGVYVRVSKMNGIQKAVTAFVAYAVVVSGAAFGETYTWAGADTNAIGYRYANVGIGTSNPDNYLAGITRGLSIYHDTYSGISLATGSAFWLNYTSIYGGSLIWYRWDGSNMYNHMALLTNGKLGIGTLTPGEKLDVDGNIKGDTVKCNAVKINGWTLDAPDYVFEKGYKLPSLKDVAKHISLKKHLPDIPSAAEIKKNGVDFAEMNMTLLRKVEELTLYTIEQQRQIDELRSLIKKQ